MTVQTRLFGFIAAVLLLVLLGAATQPAGAQIVEPAPGGAVKVDIQDSFFVPNTMKIPVGTTVVWANNGALVHTVDSDDRRWSSGDLLPGETYRRTFDTPGIFDYHCRYHRSIGMIGQIVVEAAHTDPSPAPGTGTDTDVEVNDHFFSPDVLEIPAGTTVTWTNVGTDIHTVTSDLARFDSGDLRPGESFSHTFNQAGTFEYHCRFHQAIGMVGKVVVTESTTDPAPAPGTKTDVRVEDFFFSPTILEIPLGTTVTWTNFGSEVHTATSDLLLWDSGDILPGESFSRTFNRTGTFDYHCRYHRGIGMIGQIVVTPANTLPDPGTSDANLALGRPAVASSSVADHPPGNATDGNAQTYWRSASVPAWIYVDLGSPRLVSRVVLDFATAEGPRRLFSLFARTDDGPWVLVHDGTERFSTARVEFPPINARYVMMLTPVSTLDTVGLREFEIYAAPFGVISSAVDPILGGLRVADSADAGLELPDPR